MKKQIIRVIGTILLLAGGGTVIHNTTDSDIEFTLPNGIDTVLVATPLPKHEYKKYPNRDLNKINSIDIHHTATDTLTIVEHINNFIIKEREWEKLPYHFLIDYKGDVYWNNELDVKTYHNSKNNTKGIGIALIGNFKEYKANDKMLYKLYLLVNGLDGVFGLESINAHGNWKNTSCCGDSLYPQLKEWKILRNNYHGENAYYKD